jgi:S1-C subfamily serine protease
MNRRAYLSVRFVLTICFVFSLLGQAPEGPTTGQIIERAYPSVALVLTGRTPEQTTSVGAAVVVRQNGILLTAYHVVKDAYAVQVRFKSGEIFDQVQLLGVDARRDVAAIKIIAAALPVLPVAVAAQAKAGDGVTVVSHPASLPWSASAGVVSAFRLADEIPGAGSGYRLIQFTAASSPGSSGGVLIDKLGNALGVIVGSLPGGQNLNFAVPIDSVIGLSDTAATKSFASGAELSQPNLAATVVAGNPPVTPPVRSDPPNPGATPEAPEKSDLLSASKDPDFILRNFKTMYVEARGAQFFGSDQMKTALGGNKEFANLNIRIVDDRRVADTVLEVGYTFAWDYPFELKHQNTTVVLLSGKGVGPFSGVAGAASVASEFVKLAKPYRSGRKK